MSRTYRESDRCMKTRMRQRARVVAPSTPPPDDVFDITKNSQTEEKCLVDGDKWTESRLDKMREYFGSHTDFVDGQSVDLDHFDLYAVDSPVRLDRYMYGSGYRENHWLGGKQRKNWSSYLLCYGPRARSRGWNASGC